MTSLVLNVPDGSSSGPCCVNVLGDSSVDLLPGGGPGFPGTASAHFDFTGSGGALTDDESVSWTWKGPFSIASIDLFLHVQGSGNQEEVSLFYTPGGLMGVVARRRA